MVSCTRITRTNEKILSAFTLVEAMVSLAIIVMIAAGTFYGFVQSNRMAQWSAMSLAAQSYAAQGAELAKAAEWNSHQFPYKNGVGTGDELPPQPATNALAPSLVEVDTNRIPQTGALILLTNYIYVTTNQTVPPLRQIRSDIVWRFPLTGQLITNTIVTLRAPDQ
jgi:type II secretory pathway pseudopilin PulG